MLIVSDYSHFQIDIILRGAPLARGARYVRV